MYLEKIESPSDLKQLNAEERGILASEMRNALLEKISVCGGHFGPNFGIVEATIALHYVFDSPEDRIVFDVSHQSYCHKMLTGRKDAYLDPAKYNDVTGYTCPEESEHDIFNVGHTSTSVSLACGLAKARDLMGGTENVIAVIGDGALSGGEALEGLDFAWELHSNLIIIVNDNGMSISDNYGGLYQNLKTLRESDGKAECNIFRSLGFDYCYLKEGNDVEKLIEVFQKVKDIDHPIIVHINTVKGKGYVFAEEDQENYHWKPPFDIETGKNKRTFTNENYDDIVCDFLLDKMKKDKTVVAMAAGVPLTIGFHAEKRKAAGKQFVDVGIAEEHAVAMAAGIAKRGGKPVFATHSSFFQRTYDQISQELCINRCPATLLVRNASVWGMNDVTHLGIFDIPLLSNIPNLVYLAPTNKQEYLAMLEWSIEQQDHPVAIRIPRNGVHYAKDPVDLDYSNLNQYKLCERGSKIAILALGDFFQLGEETSALLEQESGIKPTLVNPRYITGIDVDFLRGLEQEHTIVVTLEDGILSGGFGEKIAAFYGTSGMRVLNYGLKKEFIDRFNPNDILLENRLTASQIVEDLPLLAR